METEAGIRRADKVLDDGSAEFARAMAALGHFCGKTIDAPIIAIYDKALHTYGYGNILKAIEAFVEEADANPRFPSVKDIKRLLGDSEVDDASKAREAAARLIAAVGKFGSMNPDGKFQRQRDYMGELAWLIADMQGGYSSVCETLSSRNTPSLQAQYRDIGLSILQKAACGRLNLPPGIEEKRPSLVESCVNKALSGTVDVGSYGNKEKPDSRDPRK